MRRVGSSSVALALLLIGCATGGPTTPPSPDMAASPAPVVTSPSPALTLGASPLTAPSPTPTVPYEEVEFAADDGPVLRGRVWSESRVGVVLAHGFSMQTGQGDWNAFAEYLAGLGYGVLTFDFRGFCDSRGCSERPIQLEENWRDAAAAVEYQRSRGSKRIFIVAASMGGLAAFRAADEADLDLAGIVSLATPQFPSVYYAQWGEPAANNVTPERLERIAAPKLFIAGKSDVQGSGDLAPGVAPVRFAEEARSMFEASREPKQLEIVDSGNHSSQLVTTAGDEVVDHTRALIVAFIEEHA